MNTLGHSERRNGMKTIRLSSILAATIWLAASVAPTAAKAHFFSTDWKPMGLYSFPHGVHTYGLYVLVFGSSASAVNVQTFPPHVSHMALARCTLNGVMQPAVASLPLSTSVTPTNWISCPPNQVGVDAGGWFND